MSAKRLRTPKIAAQQAAEVMAQCLPEEAAKVTFELDPTERRGRWFKDPKTGEKVKLGGKIQELPLNAYEVRELSKAAALTGQTLTGFIRAAAMKAARDT